MILKKWEIAPRVPQKLISEFSDFHPLILQLLWKRGVINPKSKVKSQKSKIEEFFNPEYERGLYDPFLMKEMEKAVERIIKAIKDKEKIAIWGDYDVDGLTSMALMSETLKFLGNSNHILYLPEKEKEGYGLNEGGIKSLASKKVDLLITVDCGIASVNEIDLANKLGMEVIVTDHHELPSKLPKAYAIINPKRKGCKYPFKDLAGVGVAFKLACGLLSKSKIKNQKSKIENFLKWLLDLVALGTLADIVSLLDENRVLVKYGLIVLSKTKRIGLETLLEICKINQEKISAHNISFQISPRLNAAGRMGNAKIALDLLLTDDAYKAAKLSNEIDKLNTKRQSLTEKILKEARAQIGEINSETKLLMVAGENWPVGILGVVASRLKDEFSRPVLVFNKDGVIGKGSARSVDGFNITEALDTMGDILIKSGGHSRAAGLSLPEEFFEHFYEKLHKLASKHISEDDLIPIIEIDAELNLEDITFELYEAIKSFEPFGLGNHEPHFLVKKAKIEKIDLVGAKRQHLKMIVSQEDKEFSALGFGMGKEAENLKIGDKIDIVFHLISDDFNGYNNLALKIVDLKKNEK